MKLFRRLLEWITDIEIVASVIALATICILTLATMVARQIPSWSMLWGEEVSLLLMKVLAFIGAAAMYATKTFIAVDGLYTRIPDRLRRVVHVFGWFVIVGFAAVVAAQGLLTYPRQINVRSYLLEWPKFYFTVPLIVGAVSIMLTSVYYLAAEVLAWRRNEEIGSVRIAAMNDDGTP